MKRNESGSGSITAPVILGVLFLIVSAGSCGAMSAYNGLNAQEKGVTAVWRDSQVQYDTFWKKVKETAQVTDNFKESFRDIFMGSVEKRYEGKDPAFLALQEANPNLSPDLWVQVQRVIESGRNDFAQTQRSLIDRQRRYETSLTDMPAAMYVGFFGFPREVSGEYRPKTDTDGDGRYTVLDYKIVTSDKTQDAFSTGKDEPLNVFGK